MSLHQINGITILDEEKDIRAQYQHSTRQTEENMRKEGFKYTRDALYIYIYIYIYIYTYRNSKINYC